MPLERLNDEQRAAALAPNGVSLVRAGAGTGKTSTLIGRVYHLQTTNPGPTLLMAFNTKIIPELKEKAAKVLSEPLFKKLDIRTSHSLAYQMVRQHYRQLGLSAPPKVYEKYWDALDEFSSYLMDELRYGPYDIPTQLQLKVIHAIDVESLKSGTPLTSDFAEKRIPGVMRKKRQKRRKGGASWEERREQAEAVDILSWAQQFRAWRQTSGKILFADQLPMALMLGQQAYTDMDFKHVLVDESQDLSILQHQMIERFAKTATSITYVGDMAQSIYSFAGASPDVFNSIPERFPGCHLYKLETNYRCSNEVLELANKTLKEDLGYDITMKPSEDRYHGNVELYGDSKGIIEWLKSAIASVDHDWSKLAILYRAHSHIPDLEVMLQEAEIPYYTGKGGFFDSEVVKDILAWLKFSHGMADQKEWETVYKTFRYLGKAVGTEVWVKTQGEPHTWSENYPGQYPSAVGNGPKKRKLWDALLKQQDLILADVQGGRFEDAVDGILDMFEALWTERYVDRRDVLKDVMDMAQAFRDFITKHHIKSLAEVLKFVEARKNDQPHGVQLLTVHKAKGLEWPYVAIWNVGPRRFPLVPESAADPGWYGSEEDHPAAWREEIHLLYVAATRAMWRLAIFLSEDTDEARRLPLVRHIKDQGTELLNMLNSVPGKDDSPYTYPF